jgi:hypothetical protein
MQRSGASSGPVFLALLFDDDTKLLLESALAQMNHKSANKYGGPYHDQDEKHDLLEGIDDTEVD